MKHYGDITKIKGSDVPIVDIVTGGSPCQDLSVAGKRAGLDGERSGLFMEQIRVFKEMRDESIRQLSMRGADVNVRHIRPRFFVWENVPGALSSPGKSNRGADFRCVLEEVCRIADKDATVPMPDGGHGVQAVASWGMDIQWLGEYTMRSFGEFPNEERESRLSQILEAYPHPKYCLSAKACQGILRRAESRGKELPPLLKETLMRQSLSKNEQDVTGGAKESSYNATESEPCQHLTTNQYCKVYGISPYDSNAMKSANPHSGIYEADTSRTLDLNGGSPACNQGGMVVLEGNGSRPSHQGDGYKESEVSYTLNSTEQHAVCYESIEGGGRADSRK